MWIYILFWFESELLICHMKNKNQNETTLLDPCDSFTFLRAMSKGTSHPDSPCESSYCLI